MRTLLFGVLLWQVLVLVSAHGSVVPSASTPSVSAGQVKAMDDYLPPPPH